MIDKLSETTIESIARDMGIEEYLPESLTETETDDSPADTEIDEETLFVEVNTPEWDLIHSGDCRQTLITALEAADVTEIVVYNNGLEYHYSGLSVSLLCAAGRFVHLLDEDEQRLAQEAAADPLSVIEELRNRAGPVAALGEESGLIDVATHIDGYDSVFHPHIGLSIAGYRVDQTVPDGTTLKDVSKLDNGSEVRLYRRSDDALLYALDPIEITLPTEDRRIVNDGYDLIAEGHIKGNRKASRAIDEAADESVDPILTSTLKKHTDGYGILEDLFSDPRVTDVFATSPVSRNPLKIIADGEQMVTNIYLSPEGAGALSSRIRRASGRAFSRANPTVDAKIRLNNETELRVAGVTEPVVEETAFAFRETGDDRFTLPKLVANGTITPEVAAFLSVAVERNAASLIAGTRGAGKTTLLGTLLYELAADTRSVVIEDTPELPVETLQELARDVQPLRTGTGQGPEISPVDALRTALRLGDGALVVGEIRGEEAKVLYEAMRVGANANAVLGTIHGDGAEEIYERVVHDLNVPPTSFGVTDLIVTVQAYQTPTGKKRRVSAVEGVISDGDDVRFESLYTLDGDVATSTGRIGRGESRVVEQLTTPEETYADFRALVDERKETMQTLANDGRTQPHDVVSVYGDRGIEST
jgi:type IV secretory pathway ATPase VirB11/archaellum biosynthesis ATPase